MTTIINTPEKIAYYLVVSEVGSNGERTIMKREEETREEAIAKAVKFAIDRADWLRAGNSNEEIDLKARVFSVPVGGKYSPFASTSYEQGNRTLVTKMEFPV